MEIIKLSKPLLVNGKERSELPYDFDALQVDAFSRAESNARRANGGVTSATSFIESNYTYHLYLAFEAVCAADGSIDVHDLERLSGVDVMHVMRLGRFFIMRSAVGDKTVGEGDSAPETSEAPSDGTAESTGAAQKK